MRNHLCKSIANVHNGVLTLPIRWAVILLLAFAVCPGSIRAQANVPRHPIEITLSANPFPDANERARMQQSRKRDLAFDAANAERRKEIAQETAVLVRLAAELKAALNSKQPEEMAISVRKAELIERLARDVQDKMKLTVYAR